MFKQALSEIRLHPGRFVATVIAITISVAFIAAISIFVSTAQNGLGRSNAMHLSQADLVVRQKSMEVDADSAPADDLPQALAAVPGVQKVASIYPGAAEIRSGDRSQLATLYVDLPEEFRWASLAEGRWPTSMTEVVIAQAGADKLDAKVGDTVEIGGQKLTLVGVTKDASTLWGTVAYVSTGGEMPPTFGGVDYVIKLKDGANRADVEPAVAGVLASKFKAGEVLTADAAMKDSLVGTTQGVDVLKYLLWTFAGVAVLVGMITIANTFTILVAQRRRQLALLRAVGASGGQVTGRLIIESLLLGLIGSVLGIALAFLIATIGAAVTGLLYWGLSINWVELAVALLIGTVATMVSAIAPSISAARVKPLEALQVVPTAAQAKRASVVRLVVCSLFALAGIGLIVLSQQTGDDMAMAWALLGAALLTVAVLAGAPLYIAPLLRLAGKLVGRIGPTSRLAMENSARNPRRAAATATALMLAIGLIVTLQVGLASTRSTAVNKINEEFPLDVAGSYMDGVPAGLVDQLRGINGVRQVAVVRGKEVEVDGFPQHALDDKARADLGVTGQPIPDGVARFGGDSGPAGQIVIAGQNFKVERDKLYPYSTFAVNSATFEKLPGEAKDFALWVKLEDRSSPTALAAVFKAFDEHPGADLSNSGAQIASILEQVIGVVLIIMTALLGVAVLIAIVGVGNTLGLSVIERQRESALLRALGMQRGQLRLMLLIEAFALVGIGAIIGFAAGAFFGWLGLTTVLGIVKSSGGVVIDSRFALDPWWTAALVAVCVVAAVLASLLPGRRAANATPTEALAVD